MLSNVGVKCFGAFRLFQLVRFTGVDNRRPESNVLGGGSAGMRKLERLRRFHHFVYQTRENTIHEALQQGFH